MHRGNLTPTPASPLPQLLQDQLPHAPGVGLAAHRLHHRADEGAGGGVLAVADLGGDVGVGRDRLVDGGRERAVIGDDGEAAGLHDLLGGALAGEEAVELWSTDGRVLEFVRDAWRHGKAILALGTSSQVLSVAGIDIEATADMALVMAESADEDALSRFIGAVAAHRNPERETDPPRA